MDISNFLTVAIYWAYVGYIVYQIFLFLDQLFDDSNIGILSKFNFIHILEFPATVGKSQPSMSLLMYYQIMAKS